LKAITISDERGELMPSRKKRNNRKVLVPEAQKALDEMKNEIVNELDLPLPSKNYRGNIPTALAGTMGGLIGGRMVHQMIRTVEQQMAQQ